VSTSVDRSPILPLFQSRRIVMLSVQDEREETTPVDHNNNADMDISPKRRDATDAQGAAAPKTMAEEIIKKGDIAKKADEYTKELDQASNLFSLDERSSPLSFKPTESVNHRRSFRVSNLLFPGFQPRANGSPFLPNRCLRSRERFIPETFTCCADVCIFEEKARGGEGSARTGPHQQQQTADAAQSSDRGQDILCTLLHLRFRYALGCIDEPLVCRWTCA
jgi:hypothetical protein